MFDSKKEVAAVDRLPAPVVLTPDQLELIAAGVIGGFVATPTLVTKPIIICGGIPPAGPYVRT